MTPLPIDHKSIGRIERRVDAMAQRVTELGRLLTPTSLGARDSHDGQRAMLTRIRAEIASVRQGGNWGELNDLLLLADNLDNGVIDMIAVLKHPDAGRKAWEEADNLLP